MIFFASPERKKKKIELSRVWVVAFGYVQKKEEEKKRKKKQSHFLLPLSFLFSDGPGISPRQQQLLPELVATAEKIWVINEAVVVVFLHGRKVTKPRLPLLSL